MDGEDGKKQKSTMGVMSVCSWSIVAFIVTSVWIWVAASEDMDVCVCACACACVYENFDFAC